MQIGNGSRLHLNRIEAALAQALQAGAIALIRQPQHAATAAAAASHGSETVEWKTIG
jgi:hypothetical protein